MKHKDFNIGKQVTDIRLNRVGIVKKLTTRSVYVKFGKSTMRANRFYADEYLVQSADN